MDNYIKLATDSTAHFLTNIRLTKIKRNYALNARNLFQRHYLAVFGPAIGARIYLE